MRDLPPVPADVVRITATLNVNGDTVSTGWWVFAPGADDATPTELEAMLGEWFTGPIASVLDVVSTDTSVLLLECVTGGGAPLVVSLSPAPNAGVGDGTTALNAAVVWTWQTGVRNYGARTHNWLPLSRSLLGADKRRLSPIGFAVASSRAITFLAAANAVGSPDGALCVLSALHRSHSGVPLSSSLLLPVLAAKASPVVGTLRRRTSSAPRAPSAT